jgi:hypothetical protein
VSGRFGVFGLLLVPSLLSAQSFELSPDTTTVLGGVVVDRRQPAEDDGATVTPTAIGPSTPGVSLPDGSNLDAFDRFPNGDVVFSTDITVAVAGLPAPGIATPGDVVMVDEQGAAIVFSAAAVGLPAGTDVDAVGAESDSDLLLSFDTTVNVGGVVVDDEDVVRIDTQGAPAVLVYDGSARGVVAGLDLDGVYRSLDDDRLLLSFDGSGSLGGIAFDDEDLLEWDPATGAYALAYDGSAPPAAWSTGADVDAVSGFAADDDGDGFPDVSDNCPHEPNPTQSDVGGIGAFAGPDGIGDECQCGDVNGDGRVLTNDATFIQRSLLAVPTATLAKPQLCDVGGSPAGICNTVDATIIKRALLATPTLTVQQVCSPALL